MKNIGKRTLSLLLTLVMLMSLVAVPGMSALAAENDPHLIKAYGSGGEHAPWFNGTAVDGAYMYTISDLSSGLKFHLPSSSTPMGTLAFSSMTVDGAYHTYKVEIAVPENMAEDTSTFVYMSGGWSIQNHEMDNDLKAYGGKTLVVEFDVKAIAVDGGHEVYIANMKLLSKCEDNLVNGACSKCGIVYENVTAHTMHSYDYQTYKAWGDDKYYVEEADAYKGGARAFYNQDLTAGFNFYPNNKGVKMASLPLSSMNKDGAYHTYDIDITVPEADVINEAAYIYFSGSWSVRSWGLATGLKNYAGKTMGLKLSMKLVSTGEGNRYDVFIDNIQILDKCEDNLVNGTCSKCGLIVDNTVLHELKNYNYKNFNGDTVVEDKDAYLASAKVFKLNLSADKTKLYRYEAGNPNGYEFFELGYITKAEIQANLGKYHVYSITTTMPATGMQGNGNMVYFTESWSLQNAQMSKDLYALAGKTVTILISMKVTGDDLSAATVYVDNMKILDQCADHPSADKTTCTICGKSLLDETLPKELQFVNTVHIKRYDTDDFPPKDNTEKIIDDADSVLGKAWFHDLKLSDGLDFGWEGVAISGTTQNVQIKNIPYSEIKQDSGYQFYKVTYDVPENITAAGKQTYLDWRCCNKTIVKDLMAYSGKTVDIYISMKVTDVYTRASDNAILGNVYVDQMILVDSCQNYQVGSSCSVCGDKITVNPEAHIVKTYGTSFLGGGSHTVIDDTAAYSGKAAQYAAVFDFTKVAQIPLFRYDTECVINGVDNHYMELGHLVPGDLIIDGEYHTYSFTTSLPATGMGNGNTVYFTDGWTVQNATMARDLKALAGQTVTVTISMKIEGDLSAATITVDKMQIIGSCDDYVSADGTFCTKCGAGLVDETLPEELKDIHYKHLNNYIYTSFALDGGTARIEDDADSATGKAWHETDVEIGGALYLTRYTADGKIYENLIELWSDAIVYNEGYVLYSNTFTVPEDIASANYVTVRANDIVEWFCQNYKMAKDLMKYAGQEVTVYLSMKAVGDEFNCEIYVDRMAIVSECQWDEGVVEGTTKTCTCTVCGATKTEEVIPDAPAEQYGLTLDGNVAMNFELNVTEAEAAAATLEVTINGETEERNVAQLKDGDKYVLNVELAAAQMADEVTIKLVAGGKTMIKTYSVKDYASIILNGDYDAKTKNLVKYMLAYGAASQKYFDYNTENLVDAGLNVEAVAVPTTGGKFAVEGSNASLTYYGASLIHENKITVRFYFSGSLTGMPPFVNGEIRTTGQKDGLLYVELADICPQDLDQPITVTADGLTVTYSALDYIIRMNAKGGETAALVQALYGYYVAAEAYAG